MRAPELLAHALFAKYGLHLPLNRQSDVYEREGIDLDVSTLADWVGAAAATLMPLVRRNQKYHQAFLIGKHAISLPEPIGPLFVASWIYDYGLLEEFSVAAYRSGHYKYSLQAIEKLLAQEKIPEGARGRLRDNAKIAAQKLAELTSMPTRSHAAAEGVANRA